MGLTTLAGSKHRTGMTSHATDLVVYAIPFSSLNGVTVDLDVLLVYVPRPQLAQNWRSMWKVEAKGQNAVGVTSSEGSCSLERGRW